jgi:hypothetical protein
MNRVVKVALIAGACAVLMGCPKATSVTGRVALGIDGLGGKNISVGDTLTQDNYYVDAGASITVTYDNGKSCTFTGPTTFVPGDDGSVCEKKKDNDDNNDRRDDQDKDKKENQQDQQQGQDQSQPSDNGENGANGSEGSSGINAPEVTPTSVPQYSGGGGGGSGIGGPQVIASGVPQYTSTNFIATGTQLLEAALGIVATTKIGDQLDDNDHKDNSGGGNQPPPLSQ